MLHFRICSAGIKITALWLLLVGILLAPFIFWQSFWIGVVFCVLWTGFSVVYLPFSLHSFEGSISLGELRTSQGILFKTNHRIPTRFITGVTKLQTPLLRLTKCSFLIIYTSGTFVLIPGIADDIAKQLIDVIHGGAL